MNKREKELALRAKLRAEIEIILATPLCPGGEVHPIKLGPGLRWNDTALPKRSHPWKSLKLKGSIY